MEDSAWGDDEEVDVSLGSFVSCGSKREADTEALFPLPRRS